ncbi:MAG: OmpA family protein [Myxococcota bacterium]
MVWWLGRLASAQSTTTGGATPDLDAQLFRPSIDGSGTLWVDDAGRPQRTFTARLLGQYVDDPLVYQAPGGDIVSVVHSVWELDVVGGFAAGPVRGGVRLPVVARTTSDTVGDQSGLGDVGLDLKFAPLALDAPIALGLAGRVGLPTNTLDTALGSRSPTWELAGLVSRELGPMLLAANVGVRGAPDAALENVTMDDAVVLRGAVRYAIDPDTGAALEGSGAIGWSAPLSNGAGHPLELLASGYRYTSTDLVLRGGVGTGLTPGIGAPDLRVVVGAGWEPRGERAPNDPDRDGITGGADACPNDPEDPDGVRDSDGCPDPTNVLVIAIDAATQEPIDVAKLALRCGSLKVDGGRRVEVELTPTPCDVVATAAGYAPAQQSFQVGDGEAFEVAVAMSAIADARVRVTRDRIDLRDAIRFQHDSATILPESFSLLDEAADVLVDYPEIERLRIEGHTDETGPDEYNLELSRQRAAAVRTYLIEHGVQAARLVSVGYGETRPLDPGHDAAAWEKNRRTEFYVEQWRDTEESR